MSEDHFTAENVVEYFKNHFDSGSNKIISHDNTDYYNVLMIDLPIYLKELKEKNKLDQLNLALEIINKTTNNSDEYLLGVLSETILEFLAINGKELYSMAKAILDGNAMLILEHNKNNPPFGVKKLEY